VDLKKTVSISNSAGLHARPCHAIVSAALEYQSELRVRLEGRQVNGKSILELMSLNACCGKELELHCRGKDAEELMGKLLGLFESGFGEGATADRSSG
jgi:phosphocarrier protein